MRSLRAALLSLLAVSLVSGCFLYGGTFGENSGKKPQRHLRPAAMDSASQPRRAASRVIRLRVYADAEYQRETRRWQARFRALITRANEVLAPLLGLRLEVAEFHDWDRTSPIDDRQSLLQELYELDRGDTMTWVVGLVPSLPKVAVRYDELGAAVLGGRHLFVRNVHDISEHRALESGWSDLSEEERDQIYRERKKHRELVVLLHELAHTLGVEHTGAPESIMYEGYRTEQRGFTAESAATMRSQLAAEQVGKREVDDEKRAEAQLEGLRTRVQTAVRAARTNPDVAAARAGLVEVEKLLAERGPEAADLRLQVAQAYRRLLLVTDTERAATAADDAELKTWATEMRVRFAICQDAAVLGLQPAEEPAYVGAYNEILVAISKSDYRGAQEATRKGTAELGDLPGFDVMRCDIALRQSKRNQARLLCQRALERCEASSWAHFLLGRIERRRRRNAAARKHLERALELDPNLHAARRELSKLD